MAITSYNRNEVARRWSARGFSCGLWVDPPGRVWANFVHEVDEIVMVLEGEEEFEMRGQVYRPRLGEELLIPAGTPHTARNAGTGISRWLYGYSSG